MSACDRDCRAHSIYEGLYAINIENLNSEANIKRFFELAKSVFVPAGFSWGLEKPSGVSDPKIHWNNTSTISIMGEKNLALSFSTYSRLYRAELEEIRQGKSTLSPGIYQK